jgi:hypothetical protein
MLAAIVVGASAAHADPVVVKAPKAPVSEYDAQLYVSKLDKAVKDLCYKAAAPMIGLNHYIYLECIKATRARVAKDDPTGLYASKAAPLVLAANSAPSSDIAERPGRCSRGSVCPKEATFPPLTCNIVIR